MGEGCRNGLGRSAGSGCNDMLWLELARHREIDHPQDAIAVYQRFVGPIVERANNDAYREARNLMRRIATLMKKLRKEDDFHRYLAAVRAEHKRKRNLMKLLDRID